MPHRRLHESIDIPPPIPLSFPLEMPARARLGHVVQREGKAVRRPSETDATKSCKDGRRSTLEMFKDFFAN